MSVLLNCPEHGPVRVYPAVGEWPRCPACEKPPVPTGVVPRRDHYAESLERGKRVGQLIDSMNAGAKAGDPIAQAVDDYLLMERKARAWDALLALYERHDTGLIHVDVVKGLVHPAQPSAAAKS